MAFELKLKNYAIVGAAVVLLLSMAAAAGASFTRNGVCDSSCGAGVLCTGKAVGEACVLGTCDSSCQCAPTSCADADNSQFCCGLARGIWTASGEERQFGGFTGFGQNGCVGDDSNEFFRFRECEGSNCASDATDSAACASANSCVFDKKCFTRADRVAEEETDVRQQVEASSGSADERGALFRRLGELSGQAQAARTSGEKREISKDILKVLVGGLKIKKERVSKAVARTSGQSGRSDVVFCLPQGGTPAPASAVPDGCQKLLDRAQAAFGSACGDAKYDFVADVNGDTAVNGLDISLISANSNNAAWCDNAFINARSPCVAA